VVVIVVIIVVVAVVVVVAIAVVVSSFSLQLFSSFDVFLVFSQKPVKICFLFQSVYTS